MGKTGPLGFLKLCCVNWRLSNPIFQSTSQPSPVVQSVCVDVMGNCVKNCFPEIQGSETTLLSCPQDPELHHPMTFTALTSSSLFQESGPGRSCPPTSSSTTCVWNLPPMYSRSLPNYFCPALMSLQQFLGWLRSPMRTSVNPGEASSISLHRDTQHSICPLNPTHQLPAVSSPVYVYILLSKHTALLTGLFSGWY